MFNECENPILFYFKYDDIQENVFYGSKKYDVL